MLYELIGIVRPGNLKEVKEIVLASSTLILRNGGVIRSLANWGVFSLPKPLSKGKGANSGPSPGTTSSNTTTASSSSTSSSTQQSSSTALPSNIQISQQPHTDPNTTPGGRYLRGHYFAIRYDASSATQQSLRDTLALDPRVLRVASVKLAGGGGHGMNGQWKLEGLGRYGWESSSVGAGGAGASTSEGAAEAGRRLWRGGMGR